MNTSKIAKVSSKFYEPGQKRYYSIEMENGDKGTISHEKENQYQVGQELKYKLTPQKDHPEKFWISEIKEKKGGFQRDYKIDFVMKSLEIASASGFQNIYELAEKFYDRMDKKYLSVKNNG